MVYKVIGLMSGSSLDGLDIAYVHLQERVAAQRGWEFQLVQTACYPYSEQWRERLAGAARLSALDYQFLHTEYGHCLGREVLRFIAGYGLEYQVQLIASHGHTALHCPARRMTAQLGEGAGGADRAGGGEAALPGMRGLPESGWDRECLCGAGGL
jgi:anhydro-N-acetylmuramic acid kinase